MFDTHLTLFSSAPQHGPRPLPLFLDLLRSETAASPDRRAAALTGLHAYQEAARAPVQPPAPAIASAGRAVLRDYGGSGRPIVFVPSLINPPHILDLAPGNSLLRWLAEQGVRPLMVDWGTPGPEHRGEDLATHVEAMLLPLLDALDEPPVLAGYCLGGTFALAAACARPVAGLAMIAAPWRFAGYGPALDDIAALWDQAAPVCEQLGLVPMEVLQSGFWRLDPARTVAKYERFARLVPDGPEAHAFVALEDWANAGAPLPWAAGRQMFDDFFAADLPGSGRWRVAGRTVAPEALTCPAIEFVSLNDRIVPTATSAGLPNRQELGAGHVGMVVGSRAREQLWEPLARWLTGPDLPR